MARIVDEIDAPEAIRGLQQAGYYVVLHTGCYEVLHAGHIACFTGGKGFEAPNKRTALVVGVESDSTLRLNREDKTRPLFSQEERIAVISQLVSVDVVIRFSPFQAVAYNDVPFFTSRLRKLRPDAFLISYNNAVHYFNEVAQQQAQECAEAGVTILPAVHNIQTRATDAVNALNRPQHIKEL